MKIVQKDLQINWWNNVEEIHSSQESQQLQAWNLWEIVEKGIYLTGSYKGEGISFPEKAVQLKKSSDVDKTTIFRIDSQKINQEIKHKTLKNSIVNDICPLNIESQNNKLYWYARANYVMLLSH